MSITAQEVIVALRSDGAGEVAQDVESVTEGVEDSADQIEETGEDLDDFSAKFAGAATAILGGIALMAGGLLSQVPIVGEAMAGLGAVFDALAFQSDQLLRPALGRIRDFLFRVAEAIFNADGAMGDLLGAIIPATAAIAGIGATALSAIGALNSLGLTTLTMSGALGTALAAVKALVVGLAGLVSLPVVIGAAIALLAFIFRDELAAAFDFAIDKAGEFVSGLMDKIPGIREWISDVTSRFTSWASDLISRAVDWGMGVAESFISGLRSIPQLVADVFTEALNNMIETVNLAINLIPEDLRERFGIEEFEQLESPELSNLNLSQGAQQAQERGTEFVANRLNVESNVNIDGRTAGRATASERFDETSRRGTFN